MVDLAHVADLWEENQECLKQRLGQSDSLQFGARWVLMPEAPFPRFNHASRIRIPASAVEDLIQTCRAFFRDQGLPICSLMVTPATCPVDLGTRLYRLGFTSEPNPVMLWDGTPVRPENPYVRVELAPRSQQSLVFELIRRVFFPHATAQTLSAGRRGVTISYELGALNYVAYWGTRPAGAGMLFCHGGMGGIYNMCTLPEFRGSGVATAIMAAALRDAVAMGCTHVGLTPTSMGRPLYERLGFREIYQERYFVERFQDLTYE
ncbi:MAG TPA: GNAT family N-acetyltransferase [Symbiobacteriaceae bacterium]|nr:GNAT family N-acetyltransferase [Symbiobacteriaceae bacterium]